MRRKKVNRRWCYQTDVVEHLETKGYDAITSHLNEYYFSESRHVISVSVVKNGGQYDAVIISKTLIETDE